jgi:hypothetical protein
LLEAKRRGNPHRSAQRDGDCSDVPCQAATQAFSIPTLRALDFPAAMIVQGRGRSAETSVIHL